MSSWRQLEEPLAQNFGAEQKDAAALPPQDTLALPLAQDFVDALAGGTHQLPQRLLAKRQVENQPFRNLTAMALGHLQQPPGHTPRQIEKSELAQPFIHLA